MAEKSARLGKLKCHIGLRSWLCPVKTNVFSGVPSVGQIITIVTAFQEARGL